MVKRKGIASILAVAMLISSISVIGQHNGVDAAKAKMPKLSSTQKKLDVGKGFTLKIKKNGTKIVKTTWKTSKKKIVTLSKQGKASVKVTAVNPGKVDVNATVKYKAGSSKARTKKLSCKVTVNEIANTPDNGGNGNASVTLAPNPDTTVTQPPVVVTDAPAPTAAPTSTPTPVPYYYDYKYFGMFDASKSAKKENLYVNFVLSDMDTNNSLTAIESVDFKFDTESEFDIDLYIAEYDCDVAAGNVVKVDTIHVNGTKDQEVNVDMKGSSVVEALRGYGNVRTSFGFVPTDGKGKFVLHDMYVNYYDKNIQDTSHHMAAISAETSSIGSAKTQYNAEKEAAKKADESFNNVLGDYLKKLPEGLFEVRPKDAAEALGYSRMADLTEAKGYKFGTCVTYSLLKNDPEFCKLLAHHCDSITAMNEFKAYSLLDEDATLAAYDGSDETSMPCMNYERADYICEWAKANNIQIRGHALVWDAGFLDNHKWFFTKGFQQESDDWASNEICRKRLKYYVEEVMKHFEEKYPGVLYCWDVVNEGCSDNATGKTLNIRENRMGDNPFFRHCSELPNGAGEDYIKFTFDCAYDVREEMINSPDYEINDRSKLELVYNDYNVINSETKRGYIYDIVAYLNEDPNRQLVDSVGCQGYLGQYQKQDPTNPSDGCLADNWIKRTTDTIEKFSKMDPPVHIQLTEMAMRNPDYEYLEDARNGQNSHAEFAAKLFDALADINSTSNNAFTSMSMWAFIDDPVMNKVEEGSGDYWQYTPFSGLFDDCYRPKPAFERAHDILSR